MQPVLSYISVPYNYEIIASTIYDISEVKNTVSAVILKIQFEPVWSILNQKNKTKTKLSAGNVIAFLINLKKKANLRPQNFVESKWWCQ